VRPESVPWVRWPGASGLFVYVRIFLLILLVLAELLCAPPPSPPFLPPTLRPSRLFCRPKMVEILKEKFADLNLTYSIGGQISFDVFPQVNQSKGPLQAGLLWYTHIPYGCSSARVRCRVCVDTLVAMWVDTVVAMGGMMPLLLADSKHTCVCVPLLCACRVGTRPTACSLWRRTLMRSTSLVTRPSQ
jgi:hypothetical protein